MVNFLDSQTDARRMAALLADYDRRLQALERTTQASRTSIEGGAIAIYDKEGKHRGSVGVQPDGAVAIVPKNSPPPPTPTKPSVQPALAGLVVEWDGTWDDRYVTPTDFALVQVHVGLSPDFTPSLATLAGTIADIHGGRVTLGITGYTPVWVRLVGLNTAAAPGPASTAVQGIPRQAVSQDLIDGIIGELKLADDAVTAAKVAVGAINSQALAAAAVTAEKLGAAAVEAGKIAAGAVTKDALAVGSVTAGAVAANAITAAALAAGSVTAAAISAGSVTAGALAANSVTAEKLVAGAVQAAALAVDAVTAGKIAADAVTAREIKALSITAAHLAVNSVTASAIQAGIIDASHIKAGAISADKIGIGTTGNLVPDPSFEGAITAVRVQAAGADWAIVATGHDSPKALQVSAASPTPATRGLALTTVPVLPGEAYYLSFDYLASSDWAGSSIRFYAAWEDASGTALSWGTVLVDTPARGTWTRAAGQHQVPAGAVRARFAVETYLSTAGTVAFDNVEVRPVIGARGSGPRAELSPAGLRLFDGGGDETVSLVSGNRNFLTLTTNGLPVATIDDRGNGNFANLSVAGTLTIGGDSLENVMTYAPRGILAHGRLIQAVAGGASAYGFAELAFRADPTRMYRIVLDCFATASTDGGEVHVSFRDGGASTPSVNSPVLQTRVFPLGGNSFRPVHVELVRSGADFGAGLHRILSTFNTMWGPPGQTATLFGRDDVPAHMYVEDIGPVIPDTGVYNSGGGTVTPPRQTVTRYYGAAWSGSYANRGAYNNFYGNTMMQGYYSSNNGLQASLVGFNLGSDLAGAEINEVAVYLYFDHWYSASGGTAIIRAHGHGSRPATFSSDSDSVSESFGRNEGKWVDISRIFDSTSWRGIALDPNNTSSQYYGRARGAGEDYAPQLRVTFTK
ncbi:hypothetical protein OG723_44225 (plasmid) [Streptomyces sp. NBC_01278]|uniref:hypothetical protein n=1 Tax=Streptomyces sp. NBC_01278 TaxID=2903809 RepID=UPI002E3735B6|nr:hypothetical protein [Streptomyces sp. NBC_01278]